MGFGEVAVGVIFSGILFCLIIFPFALNIQPNIITFIIGAAIGAGVVMVLTNRMYQ